MLPEPNTMCLVTVLNLRPEADKVYKELPKIFPAKFIKSRNNMARVFFRRRDWSFFEGEISISPLDNIE